jgi:predicted transposase YbfD/YdcC
VPDGSNEIAVIPELLRPLELTGAIVSIDAAGCQTGNAKLIRERKGHHLLAVKGNQPTLRAAVEGAFERACEAEFEGVRHDTHAEFDARHGRREERSVTVLYGVDGVRTSTTHYYLSSDAGTAAELGGYVRGHWGIEAMHWVLDVVFREDDSRVREGHAGANLAMVRRVAVSLLRRAPGKKRTTTPTKRKKAGWDDDYLLQVLQGITG